jgi:hypothetical protein
MFEAVATCHVPGRKATSRADSAYYTTLGLITFMLIAKEGIAPWICLPFQ